MFVFICRLTCIYLKSYMLNNVTHLLLQHGKAEENEHHKTEWRNVKCFYEITERNAIILDSR